MNTKGGLRDGDLKGTLTQSNSISSEREGVIIAEGEMGLKWGCKLSRRKSQNLERENSTNLIISYENSTGW